MMALQRLLRSLIPYGLKKMARLSRHPIKAIP